MAKRWTDVEEKRLVTLFPHASDKEIARILNKSARSIQTKARRLKLYKSENFLMKTRQETGKNIASGKHRHQFTKGDPNIFYGIGSAHPKWIADRSQIKGDRRRQYRFSIVMITEIRTRQKSHCNICNKYTEAGEFDHIIPVCVGGTSWIDNCQFLCINCHRLKTKKEQQISHNFLDLTRLKKYTHS